MPSAFISLKVNSVKCHTLTKLFTQVQALDQRLIAANVFTFEVVQQTTTLANHRQQTTT